MDWDEIAFFLSLSTCLSVSGFYKNIENIQMKKVCSSTLGFLVILMISGRYIIHAINLVVVNTCLLIFCHRSLVHICTSVFSWLYLIALHLNIVYMPRCGIIVMGMIILRLTGLAFELNTSYMLLKQKNRLNTADITPLSLTETIDYELLENDPEIEDILHYSLCFLGLHRGPYYKWQAFNDYFRLPFAQLGDCRVITSNKFRWLPFLSITFIWCATVFPIKKYESQEFYTTHSFVYRFFYNLPLIVELVMEHQIINTIGECVCTEAGFILYPTRCKPLPGIGPTQEFEVLNEIMEQDLNLALEQRFTFNTIKNYHYVSIITGPTMRKSLRGWNMTVQYWFWACIHRRLNFKNRLNKSAVTMFMWCFWKGINFGYFTFTLTLLFYIYVEDIYYDLLRQYTYASDHKLVDLSFSVFRIFCILYMAPCIILKDSKSVLRYYTSIFWIYHIFLSAMMFLGVVLLKIRNRRENQQ